MSTSVRSYSKINLGLAIGPSRADGFHGLVTAYQTLALHDLVTVSAVRVGEATNAKTSISEGSITLTSNHPRVPVDGRNTAWRILEACLTRMGIGARVQIHIEKNLPLQGGMGAGSANAAAALIGLERELGVALPEAERLELAAGIGSDVPLFLVGGAVLGVGRGEVVSAMPDIPPTACVVAVPEVGVSTPQAFRDWDALHRAGAAGLTPDANSNRLEELSRAYASVFAGPSGILRDPVPEIKQGGTQKDLAENHLLALVRTGIENDFEEVVFPQYPSLGELKRQLMGDSGSSALYAALSGSGSAVFGLYGSRADAQEAQQRVQALGVTALVTETLPREAYWRNMFAG